ncbi:MAG: thiamine diphosphokinase [Clostridiales bacterium]|nr:thiamine diphosphokinase [Clostridiales bacterium]
MTKKREVMILTGGDLSKELFLHVQKKHTGCLVLCVDGALEKAYEWHIPVDIILGDFDTVSNEVLEKYREKQVEESRSVQIESYCPEKDLTDTHLAILRAMQEDPEQILVLGATGSRLDHVLGSLHAMYDCIRQGIRICFLDAVCRISMTTDSRIIEKKEAYGSYLSVLPFSGTAKRVTLSGVKYPVENRDFLYGESIGISNEIVEKQAEIKVGEGCLLIIEAKKA